jgi:ATP-dependent helicase/nuclease subunit A
LEPLPVEGLGSDPKDLVQSNRSGTEAITRIEAPDDETARVGQAMHWLLEHEARVFGAPAGAAPDALLRSVQQRFGLDGAQADRAWSLARAARFGAAQWAWDAAVIDWQANEVPLLWQGQLLRIDRLVRRRDGAWWVLDFKSAAQPQAQDSLRLQLERYRAAVAAFHPGAEVYAGFVTGAGQFLVLPEPSPDRER